MFDKTFNQKKYEIVMALFIKNRTHIGNMVLQEQYRNKKEFLNKCKT